MTDRAALIDCFAARAGWGTAIRRPLAGDASARRYERWVRPDTGESCVLMDAPPASNGSVMPFVQIARHLFGAGFSAPAILFEDPGNGLLLIEDFGDAQFARLIASDPGCEVPLYEAATDVLAALDTAEPPTGLVEFGPRLMAEQASLVFESYAPLPARTKPFRDVLETILASVLPDRRVLILRDFHAENLIWLRDRDGVQRVGLLDFQDAMAGPVGYDLISLIHDARRDVPIELGDRLVARFGAKLDLNPTEFDAVRAALCAQRNLRILGIFARLARTTEKTGYVDLMPRVWGHLTTAMAHPALNPLRPFIADLPKPTPAFLARMRVPCG